MGNQPHVDLQLWALVCLAATVMLGPLNRGPNNQQQPPAFAYYKLSLHWPPGVCTANDRIIECVRRPILGDFRIHGLWPTLQNDTSVPPYDPQHPCTNPPLVLPEHLMQHLTHATQQRLKDYWPMLSDYEYPPANEAFWQQVWGRHGICSEWPNSPERYFDSGIHLGAPRCIDLRQYLQRRGLGPSLQIDYKVGQIWDAIRDYLNIEPEIACNQDDNGTRQLFEVRLCYHLNNQRQPPILYPRDCPRHFAKSCSNRNDRIIFRPVY